MTELGRLEPGDSFEVFVTRKIGITNPIIGKKDYTDFRELIDKWNTRKFKQLIFK